MIHFCLSATCIPSMHSEAKIKEYESPILNSISSQDVWCNGFHFNSCFCLLHPHEGTSFLWRSENVHLAAKIQFKPGQVQVYWHWSQVLRLTFNPLRAFLVCLIELCTVWHLQWSPAAALCKYLELINCQLCIWVAFIMPL